MIYQDKPSLDYLMHYGKGHLDGGHSGRYPWGSGDEPYQHAPDFLSRVKDLQKEGFSIPEIARAMGFVERNKDGSIKTDSNGNPYIQSTQLRTQMSLAKDEIRMGQVARAKELRDEGHSLKEIATIMGYKNDSSIRSLLNVNAEENSNAAVNAANYLRDRVNTSRYGMVDVGLGSEKEIGLRSKEKMNQALYILQREGYEVFGGGLPQVTNKGKQTTLKVLCKPGTEHKDIYQTDKIDSVVDYKPIDISEVYRPLVYPESMDSNRLEICYKEDGGIEKDGVIELRRGVPDLSLGDSHYSQVRILVDNTKYLKGMAVYADDLPPGIDVRFNTNKSKNVSKMDVLKDITDDPDNPFGSLIKIDGQSYYDDPNGKYTDPLTGKKQSLSLINKRADESDWSDWSNALPSQFLAKQDLQLINKQLKLAMADKKDEYDEICALTNPTVKKFRLEKFSEDCDAAAVQLKAAALPGQKYHVILPVTSMSEKEVYAPNYDNGTKLALIRYPHGGTFEIPILTVNNRNKTAIELIGNGSDAIAINSKVAERLSGADFDGDTVMAIPTNSKIKITSTPELEGLKRYKYPDGHIDNFDPKEAYPKHEGMRIMKKGQQTQTQMGIISNLITDMTLKGANDDEIAAAVRHSMVVIDAAKHKLDYKQSEKDNNIKMLKAKYQTHVDPFDGKTKKGASTLISMAKSKQDVLKRRGSPKIDPETGDLVYKEVVETYKVKHVDPKTKEVTYGPDTRIRMQESTKMAEVKDARVLSSGTLQEEAYANYANYMKSLANTARKEILATKKIEYSASAKKTYQKEVDHLESQLNLSLMNKPRERKAQLLANSEVKAKKDAHPDLTKAEIRKIEQIALTKARNVVGAKRTSISISDREWEAIQAGAISESKLMEILNHTDTEEVVKRSTPRQTKELSSNRIARIKAMDNSGYTTKEIADALGVSVTTVSKYLK